MVIWTERTGGTRRRLLLEIVVAATTFIIPRHIANWLVRSQPCASNLTVWRKMDKRGLVAREQPTMTWSIGRTIEAANKAMA